MGSRRCSSALNGAGTAFMRFTLSKLGFNAISCVSFGQYLSCFRVQCILNGRYTDIL